MADCRSHGSAIRARAGSFSFCFLRTDRGPAYCRDHTGRPALISRCGRLISLNLFGPFIAARRVFSRALNASQGQARGLSDLLKSFSSAVRHVDEPTRERIPDETKSGARPGNLTARDGNA